jgi:short subunit dehydrogenase-like uncharacterized protein
MKIVVYGAAGYTGRLVVAELAARGIDFAMAGRDRQRLRAAAGGCGVPRAEVRTAALDDDAALAAAFGDCDVVISCAGPFIVSGTAVARAAITAGCHYLDISGEQMFLKELFDTLASDAARAGVVVLPGANDDCLTSDLAAHLAAERVGPADELVIGVDLRGSGAPPTRGTLRSVIANRDAFAGGGLAYADGSWSAGLAARRATLAFPGEAWAAPVVKFALPGVVTIPRHVPTRHLEGLAKAELAALFSAATAELIDAVPEGPAADSRRAGGWFIVAEATGRDGRTARATVEGTDTYGSTAVIAVESARRLATDGAEPGVLAPAQAFDPITFLDFLARRGAAWSLDVRGPAKDTKSRRD